MPLYCMPEPGNWREKERKRGGEQWVERERERKARRREKRERDREGGEEGW